jgi:hypothetical protein
MYKAMFSNQKNAENAKKYECYLCDFNCSKKSNYKLHLLTLKHKKREIVNILSIDVNEKCVPDVNDENKFICNICNKIYKDNSGLWRHKKKCNLQNSKEMTKENENKMISLLIQQNINLISQNQEFKQMMIEQNKTIIELANKTNVVNNTTNNKFNMNIFLNEKCKDAMNIMDFVSSLKISFEDLENVGEVGYVKGITNIISNGLNKLDVHKRPIHCSDLKREVFYVKDNDVWEKETEDKKKITRAIKHISYNTARKVTPWTELPENVGVYDYYNKLNDKYLKISSEANGGDVDEVSKIIKNIAGKVTIDKNM